MRDGTYKMISMIKMALSHLSQILFSKNIFLLQGWSWLCSAHDSNYKLTMAALFNIMTLQACCGLRRQRQAKPNDKSEKVADQKRPQATCQEFVISSRSFAFMSNCTSGDL